MATTINRRQFLATSAALGASTLLPGVANAGTHQDNGSGPRWDRFLILIELDGGNDGLNTVIPYQVPEYASRRPTLKYSSSELDDTKLGLGPYRLHGVSTQQNFALHEKMTHLKAAWNPGDPDTHDLAIVLGVGYTDPNLSHFRSMDIWNGGCAADKFPSNNWLGRLFAQTAVANTMPSDLTSHGVLLSRYSSNPLRQAGVRFLAMSNPKDFFRRSFSVPDTDPEHPEFTIGAHYEHLLTTQRQVFNAKGDFRDAFMIPTVASPSNPDHFTYTPLPLVGTGINFHEDEEGHDFEKRCRSIAQMIATNSYNDANAHKRLKIPVYKVQLGGFDNHSAQRTKHASLLDQLSSAMGSLRAALKLFPGLWERTLIMTYSEFGRRVEENGSAGTDHGTANCHFLLGGGIKGGFYGAQPSLARGADPYDLDSRGNLVANVDFRNLYATAATWLNLPYAGDEFMGGATPLNCFA